MQKIKFKNLIYSLLLSIIFTMTNAYAKWEISDNNCKIWVENETTKESVEWSGLCTDGFASGKGEVHYNYKNTNDVKSCIGKMLKGKMDGYINCEINNGNTFVGTIENSKIVGIGTYTWNNKNCPTCPQKYIGEFHNNLFSLGVLTLPNGKEIKLYYYPDKSDCLVWNKEPLENEKITWTGTCKDGYADGEGTLTFTSDTQTGIINTELKKGMIQGYAVVKVSYAKSCNDCPVHFKGTFKNSEPIKGVATLGNGQIKKINITQNSMSPDMNRAMADYVGSQHASWMLNYVDMGLGIPLD